MKQEDLDAIVRTTVMHNIEDLVLRRAGIDYQLRWFVLEAIRVGCGWRRVGKALGVSGQAAWEKYRPDEPPKINGKQA